MQRGAPGTFVYLVKPDNTVAVRTVDARADRRRARRGHVAGSQPGDKVVIDGADKLRDGAKVVLRRAAGSRRVPARRREPAPGHRRRRSSAMSRAPAGAAPASGAA